VSTAPAVEIRDLVKRYRDFTAVAELTMRADRGQVTAILGPNGAGKTTTIETCEGYRRPDSGSVRVLGLDPVADARQLRPKVGVMLQSGGVPTTARAGEYLRVMASFYARPLDPAGLLEVLGLSGSARTPYKHLSGGQQQRLSLAAAIIGRPELVFLDEPTAGLDPQARHATWELIEGLRTAGTAVILATHHMDEAERLADKVVIVDHGQVVASGPPAEPRPAWTSPDCSRHCQPARWPRSHPPATTWSRSGAGSTRSSLPRSRPGALSAGCWPGTCRSRAARWKTSSSS
jgi:ABC-2 type transport system ATP-binding protein